MIKLNRKYGQVAMAALLTLFSVGAEAQREAKLPGLKTVAAKAHLPFKIGTAVSFYGGKDKNGVYGAGLLPGKDTDPARDAAFRKIIAQEFNLIQTGNELKMSGVWKGVTRDKNGKLTAVCDFANLTTLAAYAIPRKLALRGHVIVYNAFYQLPGSLFAIDWSQQTATLKPEFSAEDVRDALHSYVAQVVKATLSLNARTRKKHRLSPLMTAWDVTNECVSEDNPTGGANGFHYPKDDAWYQAGPKGIGGDTEGYDYVSDIFRWAEEEMANDIRTHVDGITEADRFRLYYNDYSGEWNAKKWEALKNLVRHVKATGGRVDGMGFQTHLIVGKDDLTHAQLETSVKETVAMRLRFSITENDFRIRTPPKETSVEQQRVWQSQNYAAVAEICRKYAASCDLYQVWGCIDDGSWITPTFPGWGEATLFTGWNPITSHYDAKIGQVGTSSAYSALANALRGQ